MSPETNSKIENLRESNQNFSEEVEEQCSSLETKFEETEELNKEEKNLLEKEVKLMQRAIQEDIYKMDVVQPLQTDFVISSSFSTSQPKVFPSELNLIKFLMPFF